MVRAAMRPPRGFKGPLGVPTNVRFGGTPRYPRGNTASQKAGLAYEQKVVDVLSAIYGDQFCRAPSILYDDRTGCRMAIPDGVLRVRSELVIIEVKLSHCEKAWWQLNRLYLPLLSALVLPGTRISTVEICRHYDPEVRFPVPGELVTSLHKLPSHGTGILQWRL